MKQYEIIDVLFIETDNNTKIEVIAFDIDTGEIKTWPHHYGMFFKISELPQVGSIILID
jgi:hypothetical protein